MNIGIRGDFPLTTEWERRWIKFLAERLYMLSSGAFLSEAEFLQNIEAAIYPDDPDPVVIYDPAAGPVRQSQLSAAVQAIAMNSAAIRQGEPRPEPIGWIDGESIEAVAPTEPSEHIRARLTPIYADLKVKDGESYRPSNATEGSIFEGQWCGKCRHEQGAYCSIHTAALAGEHPPEWMYWNGSPCCVAWEPVAPTAEDWQREEPLEPLDLRWTGEEVADEEHF